MAKWRPTWRMGWLRPSFTEPEIEGLYFTENGGAAPLQRREMTGWNGDQNVLNGLHSAKHNDYPQQLEQRKRAYTPYMQDQKTSRLQRRIKGLRAGKDPMADTKAGVITADVFASPSTSSHAPSATWPSTAEELLRQASPTIARLCFRPLVKSGGTRVH